MEKSFQIKEYLKKKVILLVLALIALLLFFQLMPYHRGIFYIFYFYPMILFMILIGFQSLDLLKINFKREFFCLYAVFAFWLFYTAISIFWSLNQEEAIRQVLLRAMGFFSFYIITQSLTDKKKIKVFEKIVFYILLFNIIFAFKEVITLTHLDSSKYFGRLTFIPTGGFYNENDFASALLICSSILFFIRDKIYRLFSAIMLILILLVFFLQGARLILIIYIPFLLYYLITKTNLIFKISTVVIISLVFSYLIKTYPVIEFYVDRQIKNHILSFGTEKESQKTGSMSVRTELYIIALEKFAETKGRGVGALSVEKSISPYRATSTSDIFNIHSLFFETLANEGIIGFLCLVTISFYIVFIAINKRKKFPQETKKALLIPIFFIFSVSVPSSVRSIYLYWTMLAYTYAVIYHNSNEIHK